jgi:DNA-binding SARP family transcriptional activator/WD40 repeat protein
VQSEVAGDDVRFGVLGPIEVRRADDVVNLGGPQQRRMLTALLSELGNVISLDRMVELIWPEEDAPEGARRSLRTYVSRLRAALGDGFVVTRDSGYVLELGQASLDAEMFETLVGQARSAAPTEAIVLLDQALALWRGPAFGEFASEWWARPAAVRLDELRLVAAEERAEAQLASGQSERAVSELEALVATYPLRERLAGQLMRALHASGRQAEALRAFVAYREFLAEETGLEPSESLTALDREIAGGDVPVTTSDAHLSVRGYVLGESLGEGAFGSVYRAVQPGVGRDVAVKVIRAEFADDPAFVQRFESEAQLVARLEHPHIVPLYDFWREPGGAYLVFRFLRGGTAERSLVVDGPWTIARVSRLVDEIGGALVSAHAAGVVHWDVKPANILFDDAGIAYLADFGISVADGRRGPAGLSAGSPIYAGPEQFHGDPATPQNDVYGFAVTVWELLAGAAPFAGATASEVLRAKSTGPIGSLRAIRPDVPELIDAVLQRATAVRPDDRYPSVAEFVLAWQTAVGRSDAHSTTGTILRSTARGEVARTMAQLQAGLANPYKGLRPFGEVDARDFFGRGAQVDALHEVVDASPFVVVVGPSGSGKSSLVHAGLVPGLRGDGARVASMVPTADPIGQLRTALSAVATRPVPEGNVVAMVEGVASDGGGDLVVVVDQFEEAWTLTPSDDSAEFLDGLACVATGDGVRVITTIRADFFDRPLAHPAIGSLAGVGTFGVTPMTAAELLDAIRLPALAVGVTFEAGLDTELVAEVVSQPASLPLLQFALAELYDERTGSVIPMAAHRRMGGVAGAIATRAEQVFDGLDAERQAAARRLFARLVTPGAETADTRRRARRSELPAGVDEIVEQFGAHRLLTFDHDPATREPTVEVAHESLLRSWPRLTRWIDEDRDWLRLLGHLSAAAASWDDRRREVADLYGGSRLAATNEVLADRGDALTPLEHEFLAASNEHAAASQRRDRQTRTRLQRLLVATAVLLIVALIGAAVAVTQGRAAERTRRTAQLDSLNNRSTALRGTQRDVAALLAVESHRLRADDGSNGALLSALTQSPGFLGYTRVPGPTSEFSGTVLAHGTTAVILNASGRLRRLNLRTGKVGRAFASIPATRHQDLRIESSDDGRLLAASAIHQAASGDLATTVRILDSTSGEQLAPPVELGFAIGDLAFSPDDATLVMSGGAAGVSVIVATADGHAIGTIPGLPKPPGSQVDDLTAPLAFRGDGRFYVGSEAGPIRIVDPATASVVSTIDEPPSTAVEVLQLAPDGTSLLTGGGGRTVRLDLPSGQARWQIDSSLTNAGCANVALVATANRFYCADFFGRLDERSYATGSPTGHALDSQQGYAGTLATAAGDRMLVSFGGTSPVVSRWRLDGGGAVNTVVAPGSSPVGFTGTGPELTVGQPSPTYTAAGPYRVVSSVTGATRRNIDGVLVAIPAAIPGWIYGAVATPTGIEAVARNTTTGKAIPGWRVPLDGIPGSVSVDSGRRSVFVARFVGSRGETLVVDARTGRLSPVVIQAAGNSVSETDDGRRAIISGGDGTFVYSMHTGKRVAGRLPDINSSLIVGHTLVGSSFDGSVNLYDVDTLRPVATLPGSRGYAQQMAASVDGRTLLVRGGDRTVSIYDLPSRTRIGEPLEIDADDSNVALLRSDGKTMALGGGARGIQIWTLQPDRWASAACSMAGRNLTHEEWHTYLSWAGAYRRTCTAYPPGR